MTLPSINRKNRDMLAIENAFLEIKQKNNVDSNIALIERILKRQFDLHFDINIVENRNNSFFGMSIYPQEAILDKIVENMLTGSRPDILSDLWTTNKDWYLEIDSLLLYDMNLRANPSEIVSVLLHEIGHIVYSNSVPVKVHRIVKYNIMKLSVNARKIVSWRKSQKLFKLVFIEAVNTKNYKTKKLHEEKKADEFAIVMGYGDSLESFITKLLRSEGNQLIDRSEKDIDRDIKSVTQWTLENISELEFRKTSLRELLKTELLSNPSLYVRRVVKDIKTSFFGGKDENAYNLIVSESLLITEYKKVLKEGLFDFFGKDKKIKKISQSDIDIIHVEKDRIENEDDKIYVLDLIYSKLDRIEVALDLIEQKKSDRVGMSKDKLLRFKSELDKLRKDVITLRIDKAYGVFINYPKGYEG